MRPFRRSRPAIESKWLEKLGADTSRVSLPWEDELRGGVRLPAAENELACGCGRGQTVLFEEALREGWWWPVPAAEYPMDDGTLSVAPNVWSEGCEFGYGLMNNGDWRAGIPSIPDPELWSPRGAVPGYGESLCEEAQSDVGDRWPRTQGRGILETSDTGVENVLSEADDGLGDASYNSGSSADCCTLGNWVTTNIDG